MAVLATTNRVDSLDAALRRPGRLEREVEVLVPSRSDREAILQYELEDAPSASIQRNSTALAHACGVQPSMHTLTN